MKNTALGFAVIAVLVMGLFIFASHKPRVAAVAPVAAPEIADPGVEPELENTKTLQEEPVLNTVSQGTTELAALASAPIKSSFISNENELVISDFDTGDKPNNLGGDFGSWNKDPEDTTQGCTISFETDDVLNDPAGYSLKLDYDVDSPNPAYNGLWMKLNDLDASSYKAISFYVRGEGLNNFTKRIKLELKDSAMNSSPYVVSGITDSWQKIQVPFDRFKKVKDWSSLGEFVIVFDNIDSNPKQGTILIDQIALEN